MAYKMVDMNPVAGNTVELLSDFEEYLDRLCHDIDNAERYVNLLYYIFAYDDLTKKLLIPWKGPPSEGLNATCSDSVGSKSF